jgi:hypothetical protein
VRQIYCAVLGGENKVLPSAGAGARKLEEDTEHFARTWTLEMRLLLHGNLHLSILPTADATVDRSLAQAIQQARLAKKLNQKELAQLIQACSIGLRLLLHDSQCP